MTTDGYAFKFTCRGCGTHDAVARWREDHEDVVHYLEHAIQPAVAKAHSPLCRSRTCDLKLPMPYGAEAVGRPVRQ